MLSSGIQDSKGNIVRHWFMKNVKFGKTESSGKLYKDRKCIHNLFWVVRNK